MTPAADDGATTFDPSGLKVVITGGLAGLNRVEAENIRRAFLAHVIDPPADPPPFDYSYLLGLHRDMFGDVWDWAGTLRTSDVNIGLPWRQVETRLFELTLSLGYWADPLADQVARLHHQLVHIHPFPNGNGRWARLAADVWAVRHGGTFTRWPTELAGVASPIRAEYLAAMRAADAGDLGPLAKLHRRYTAQESG